jgi:hypothetical protein
VIDHDVVAGPLTRCQVCGSTNLIEVLDVGHQPPCDSLLTTEALGQPETYYPLCLMRCADCTLTQLDYVVPGEVVYFEEYPYRSGITKEVADYQRQMSGDILARFNTPADSLVVDIGSNDGTLLSGFSAHGMRCIGVEPTNIGQIARDAGIDTVQQFFTESLARDIRSMHGAARIVTATNVFAHMASLGEVIRGISALLADDGVFVLENHYLLDILERVQYDTIYHEHIRSYSLKSLVQLFSYYDLEIFYAERVSRYGGNIRAYVGKKNARPIATEVGEILRTEEAFGLGTEPVYQRFRERVYESRLRLVELAVSCAAKDIPFVGNSCPGRANTLINFCDLNTMLVPYLAEQPTSLKKGMYLPGKHIPIVDNSILFEEQPEYVVLFAWHYAEPIAKDLRRRGLKSKFVVPLPTVEVLLP